jgi:hypothetical protein
MTAPTSDGTLVRGDDGAGERHEDCGLDREAHQGRARGGVRLLVHLHTGRCWAVVHLLPQALGVGSRNENPLQPLGGPARAHIAGDDQANLKLEEGRESWGLKLGTLWSTSK